jgi:hypothetical protein
MFRQLEKYKSIIISIVLVFIFLSATGHFNNDLWHWIDAFITLGTLAGVWYNYKQNKKQKKLNLEKIDIKFYIKKLNKEILIKSYLIRKFFSRQEIQGVLANQLIKGVTRYDIDYLSNDKYFEDTYKIQTGGLSQLIINIEDDEIGQFTDIIFNQLNIDEVSKIKVVVNNFIEKTEDIKLKAETLEKLK